jgi:hypothetical protein
MSLGIGIGLPFGGAAAAAVPVSDITEAEILGATSLAADGGAPSIGIDGDGWVLRVRTTTLAGGSSPDPTKFTVTVQDAGYSAANVATTVTRTLTPTACLRRPANGTTMPTSTTDPQALAIQSGNVIAPGSLSVGVDVDWYLTLPDYIYPGSSVSVSVAAGWYSTAAHGSGPAVTNSAARAYPQPKFGFINTPHERVEASSYAVELACNGHRHAMNGRAVAGVELWARDGTNNGTAVAVNDTTLSTLQTNGNIEEVFAATVSLTGVNDTDGSTTVGAGVQYIDGYIYPWIGPRYQISVDGAAWPTPQPCTILTFVKDTAGKYGGAIAYVNPAGAGASPAVSRTPAANYAAAKVSAYATHAAARTAIAAFNNGTAGRPASPITHNDLGGARIEMLDNDGASQTFELAGTISEAAGNCWFDTIDSTLNAASCYYDQVTATVRQVNTLTRFKMACVRDQAAGIIGCGTAGNTQDNALMLAWEARPGASSSDITISGGGSSPWVRQVGLFYQRNLNYPSGATGANVAALGVEGTSGFRCAKAIGITYPFNASTVPTLTPYMLVGYRGRGLLTDPSTTTQTTNDGFVISNCTLNNQASANNFITLWTMTRGFYIGQSVVEFTAGQDFGPAGASTATLAVRDGIIDYVTLPQAIAGAAVEDVGRLNHAYSDGSGSRGRVVEIVMNYCASARIATKTDTFAFFNGGSITGCVLNLPTAYNVGCRGNSVMISRPDSFTASDFWRKVIDDKSQQNIGNVGWSNNQAGIGQPGGGSYVPTDTKLKSRVATGSGRRKYDQAGSLRLTDGTGYGGALEGTL